MTKLITITIGGVCIEMSSEDVTISDMTQEDYERLSSELIRVIYMIKTCTKDECFSDEFQTYVGENDDVTMYVNEINV